MDRIDGMLASIRKLAEDVDVCVGEVLDRIDAGKVDDGRMMAVRCREMSSLLVREIKLLSRVVGEARRRVVEGRV